VIRTIVAIFLAASTLSACDPRTVLDSREEVQFAKQYLALIQARDLDAVEAQLDPKLKDTQLRPQLEKVAEQFPNEKPKNIETVNISWSQGAQENVTRYSIDIQYQFATIWLLANVVLDKSDQQFVVAGVYVQPMRDSLANINRFTLDNKPFQDYVILAVAVFNPLFILVSLVTCIRTPIPKRKWFWVVFMLFGFIQLTINWASGDFKINFISLQLFGASAFRPGLGAWIVSVSVPVGAIVFWLRRREWIERRDREGPLDTPPAESTS
jgi:hypothetical protein